MTFEPEPGFRDGDLELVNYGNGYAWLRVEEPRYGLTDAGRRELAREWLFSNARES